MPYATTPDGVRLHYEEAGQGLPIVFVHEFAGDHRSWEPQMRHLSRRYRCIAYAARGYPPSDVPEEVERYSQAIAADDILAVMDHVGLGAAHVVGLSKGGFATLHFGLRHPARARSLVVAGCGYGAHPDQTESFRADSVALAERYEREGSEAVAAWYSEGAARIQFRDKDPRGWAEFRAQLGEHSAQGAALTMRGVQARRPSLWGLKEELERLTVPVLVVNGDEDDWCLDPGNFLKRTIPSCGLWVLPVTGHTINLEEPDLFNQGLDRFFATVEAGRWPVRKRGGASSALLSSEPGGR
jgi:pimeloyl-ACP methyl ester carboxylesterase